MSLVVNPNQLGCQIVRFFDNFNVYYKQGPVLEDNHYYPFGLTMAGISDKAIKTNYAENKYRFQKQEEQNKEFSDGSGLEMYEFKNRLDDFQLGRFWSIDPLATQYVYNSTYAFSENRVINGVDLEGSEWRPFQPDFITPSEMKGSVNLILGGIARVVFAPFNMIDRMNAAGNTKDPKLKEKYEQEAKGYFFETIINGGITLGLTKIAGAIVSGGVAGVNPFSADMAAVAKGQLGEDLTFGVLAEENPGATILRQVDIQMDGAKLRADFVVVQDGKVVSVVESKVDGGTLSNGQKLFFNDKDAGTLTGKNAGDMAGVKVDPSKVETKIYKWSSEDGSFTTQ